MLDDCGLEADARRTILTEKIAGLRRLAFSLFADAEAQAAQQGATPEENSQLAKAAAELRAQSANALRSAERLQELLSELGE